MKVLSKQIKNIDAILYTVSYATLAKYDTDCSLWSYLAFKGPLFLVQDKLKKKKLVILNQCNDQDYILPIHENFKFELK